MHEFEFLFKIEPAGDFGVPEVGTIITDATSNIFTPSVDRATGQTVAHGTLSHYRADPEAISLDGTLCGIELRLYDNFLRANVSHSDYSSAETVVLGAVDRFVQLLTLDRGSHFRAAFLQATVKVKGQAQIARQPKRVPLGRIKVYNLATFTESLSWVLQVGSLTTDLRLGKALDYFDHAEFLVGVRHQLPLGYVRVHNYLTADIFSNYYRAASVIVGDPSKDKDWQSRYRSIGLSYEYWKERVEHVRELRNDYGVAHYDLGDKAEQLDNELSTAAGVAKEVIKHYIRALSSNEVSDRSPQADASEKT